MVWAIKFSEQSLKQLKKLDKKAQVKIFDYMESRVSTSVNPRQFGKALSYNKVGLWRYRIDDYRVICKIIDAEIVVLVLSIGHRKNIYD